MATAINDENKAYSRLIKRFPLRPIRDDKQIVKMVFPDTEMELNLEEAK